MSLAPGTKLGPYEIETELGAGGMGEVYRARDLRLDRKVAIKVLAAHLSGSPELKQRMEREARSISSLNHPHICHLYDIGSQNGTDYLVMELLEGETLAQRLARGTVSLPDLLKIGSQVAEALAVAHRSGIVHRDLKPGNIMLTPGGAKLMDFGLAKPVGVQTSNAAAASVPLFTAAPTITSPSPLSPLTTAGSIVGTIQYMSPEQIEGKDADPRSDIFAFGAVLYEMAAGKRAFEGKSQLSLASAILEKDPEPISTIKPTNPPALDYVVSTCLKKSPDERFQTAHDIKLHLQWIAGGGSSSNAMPVPALARTSSLRQYSWLAACLLAVAVGVAAGALFFRGTKPGRVVRTVLDAPAGSKFALSGDFAGPPVLSPDGSLIAFTASGSDGKTHLWVRPMSSLDAKMLPETDGAIFPFWGPGSRSLGFFAEAKVKTVEIDGGSVQVVCDAPFGRGGAWAPDGTIVFAPNTQSGIARVPATGGTPQTLLPIDQSHFTSNRWPFMLPDGKHFLYTAINHDTAKAQNDTIFYASLDGKENRAVLRGASSAVYAAGFLLYAHADQLLARRFDVANGTIKGDATTIARGVLNDASTWHLDASASQDGLLVTASGGSANVQLVWADRSGKFLSVVGDKLTNLFAARISPEGDRVALGLDDGNADIYVLDLARGVRTRLTFGLAPNTDPVWSPDGKWIAYQSARHGYGQIYRKRADGSGDEELLLDVPDSLSVSQWTPDGKSIIFTRAVFSTTPQLAKLPLEGDRKPVDLVANAAAGSVSPDGKWIAYAAVQGQTQEIFVANFQGGEGRWQLSSGGGDLPRWTRDGKELHFYNQNSHDVYAVAVKQNGSALEFGTPQPLVQNWSASQGIYDVTPDGQKILLDRVDQQISPTVTVVSNFTAELRQ